MKKIMTAVSMAALLGAGSFAIAQDTGVGIGVDVNSGVSVETPVVDAAVGADAAVSLDAAAESYESLTSSLSSSASADLSAVTDEAQISIILLSSLQGDATAFDQALSANAEANATLHSNIDANAAIKAKLEAEGHRADDVVAVKSNADGSVIVYVDDRA